MPVVRRYIEILANIEPDIRAILDLEIPTWETDVLLELANLDIVSTNPTTFLQASHNANFVFSAANTPESIPFNTNDETEGSVSHPTGAGNEEVTVSINDVFEIVAQPQVKANASGTFHMWLQKDTGTGFVDVPNSNVELVLANNDAAVIPLIVTTRLDAGDKIRIRGSVSSTNVILEAQTPVGEPAIPSCILSMYKI